MLSSHEDEDESARLILYAMTGSEQAVLAK
jgi:hypothetical protein